MMEAPQYQPFVVPVEEIRVVDIQPSHDSKAPIQCSLRVVTLDDGLSFEALSYTWGHPEPRKIISLNGCDFEAQENLDAALRRLRRTDDIRTLWIDALCINQRDNAEKSVQVSRMGEIYERAQQVIVWLGEPDDEDNVAMQCLIHGSFGFRHNPCPDDRLTENGLVGHAAGEAQGVIASIGDRGRYKDEIWMGEVGRLLDRPYFSRCWIQQEVVLASKITVVCGSNEVLWTTAQSRLSQKEKDDFTGSEGHRKVLVHNGTLGLRHYGTSKNAFLFLDSLRSARAAATLPSIYKLLFSSRHLSCTNARDRVYAFMNLIKVDDKAIFTVDYSISTSQVYIDAARAMMRAHGNLNILNCARALPPQGPTRKRNDDVYSRFDQGRFVNTRGQVTHGPEATPREGWVMLPSGWERKSVKFEPPSWTQLWNGEPEPPSWDQIRNGASTYIDHNTESSHETYPGKDAAPTRPMTEEECRRVPPGWVKTWDNTGRVNFEYQPASHSSSASDANEPLSLPTWVPNWDQYSDYDPDMLSDCLEDNPSFWAAGKNQKMARSLEHAQEDARVLVVRGVVYDAIDELGDTWHPEPALEPLSRYGIEALENWDKMIVSTDKTTISISDFWRVQIADYTGDGAAPKDTWHFYEAWCNKPDFIDEAKAGSATPLWGPTIADVEKSKQGWRGGPTEANAMADLRRHLSGCCISDVEEAPSNKFSRMAWFFWAGASNVMFKGTDLLQRYRDFRARLIRACAHRAMFISAKGHIGLAPWNAQEGDKICILLGGCTPFLLRPVGGESKQYTLVGESYVHGLMAGEVFNTKEGVEMETIEII